MLGDLAENAVTTLASFFNFACLEGKAETLSSGVWLVDSEVAPPDSSIVPQVVIGVIFVYSNG